MANPIGIVPDSLGATEGILKILSEHPYLVPVFNSLIWLIVIAIVFAFGYSFVKLIYDRQDKKDNVRVINKNTEVLAEVKLLLQLIVK